MQKDKPLVAVVMGSKSDKPVMESCPETLGALGIPHEIRILSAHRTPEDTRRYALEAAGRGIRVIIAGAGWAAHLAGFIAGLTTLPVIGVPIDSSPLKGLDALLSTVQMPPGIPVATVSLGSGGAKNAAVLAAEILALGEPVIAGNLREYRERLTREVRESTEVWNP